MRETLDLADLDGPLLLVTAHPDDETIGFSALLARLRRYCTQIVVTDGAPRDHVRYGQEDETARQDYARIRRTEFLQAVAIAGVDAGRCLALPYADQEVMENLVSLTQRLHALVRDLKPKAVVTHAYEGGHPDHDGTAFAAHAALKAMARSGISTPALFEFAGYHRWQGAMRCNIFLPGPASDTRTVILTESERHRKWQMFACYRTQQHVLCRFPIDAERYRVAPDYDFSEAPHPGPLLYEKTCPGFTGEAWRRAALAAAKILSGEADPERETTKS